MAITNIQLMEWLAKGNGIALQNCGASPGGATSVSQNPDG